ncbi:MAG: hypothetical protein A3J93_02585 [Candidatus Magasanikbacteria bacterium RIFOXYC2_FULL_42_28]|uniref:Uncharacterized protein n=1 Tax=Candidatus Magasanikbacteria bacterium RIFOXYC2_FULL_42_28 TaxID=1798704 RepID=A0A1F6NVS5_9BACT|nr:MAG: hypothetical protein A3J93_02585 [Candidatus Magasanikbacteria bacterium RIFOXYC2_FULL_42_28]
MTISEGKIRGEPQPEILSLDTLIDNTAENFQAYLLKEGQEQAPELNFDELPSGWKVLQIHGDGSGRLALAKQIAEWRGQGTKIMVYPEVSLSPVGQAFLNSELMEGETPCVVVTRSEPMARDAYGRVRRGKNKAEDIVFVVSTSALPHNRLKNQIEETKIIPVDDDGESTHWPGGFYMENLLLATEPK